MKNKKLISLTFVAILLFTSVTFVGEAKNMSAISNTNLKNRIGEFFKSLGRYDLFIHILNIILERTDNLDEIDEDEQQPEDKLNEEDEEENDEEEVVEEPNDEEPEKDEDEEDDLDDKTLAFELIIEKDMFELGEIINVTAKLTNVGDETFRLSVMDFKLGTLDYFIDTPDDPIHFCFPIDNDTMPFMVLEPQASEEITVDIKVGIFGISGPSPSSSGSGSYKFRDGSYTITGYYRSYNVPDPPHVDMDLWEGELTSVSLNFIIGK